MASSIFFAFVVRMMEIYVRAGVYVFRHKHTHTHTRAGWGSIVYHEF